MLFKSGTMTQASGSIGGLTASHNRGGMYFRARTIPVNPRTPQQGIVRVKLAQLTNLWGTLLTAAQRDLWNTYALNVPLPNPLGDPRNVGGLGMYIRGNMGRHQASLPQVNDGPTIFDLGAFSPVVAVLASEATQIVSFTFDNTDQWANEDDAAMLAYSSRPNNASVNYFTGPYRFADRVLGDAITPPVSPGTFTSPFAFVAGQRLFYRVNVTRADGRLSLSQYLQTDATA